MKFRVILLLFIFAAVFVNAQDNRARVQGYGDADAAQKYAEWVKKAIDEGRWSEALAAAGRASDFSNVSSDVSYQFALVMAHEGKSRTDIINSLDNALDVNRWVIYNENQALLLKARELVAVRKYVNALAVLDKAVESADSAVIRLLALKGMALTEVAQDFNPVTALSRFRSQVLAAMDRYSRDPRPLRIFFEYARNRRPETTKLTQSDLSLLGLALKRLPFLLEADNDLAWLAAYFISDTEQAKRYVSQYRAGSIPSVQRKDFTPVQASIPIALNLGLIDDARAVEELFSDAMGIDYTVPPGFALDDKHVLDVGVMNEVFSLLRGEDGRDLFTQRLLSFSGTIISDDDHDGYIDSRALYKTGTVNRFEYDENQTNDFNLRSLFTPDGIPDIAWFNVAGNKWAVVQWEPYPSVRQVMYQLVTQDASQTTDVLQVPVLIEQFFFRPADFQYMPFNLVTLGGSKKYAGPAYPVFLPQYAQLSRNALVASCLGIMRPSIEFEGATEELVLEKGIIIRAQEVFEDILVSVTEFEKGSPVIQRLDMDMDGRMETIRRFYRSDSSWSKLDETFNYRRLVSSSESDWTGEGKFKTGEVYRKDGSVVYSWDTDGGGDMDYSETGNQ